MRFLLGWQYRLRMHRLGLTLTALSTLVLAAVIFASRPAAGAPQAAAAPGSSAGPGNPFFVPSTLPYHLPPFDKIKDGDYEPAFARGMAEQRQEIAAIARNPERPTFENTIVALERSGQLLNRVAKTFTNLTASNADGAMEKIEAEEAPKLSAHHDAIFLDGALFARVDALYNRRAQLELDPESAQVLDRYEQTFLRAGAKLSDSDKTRLKAINEELSSLGTKFRQNTVAATKDGAIVVSASTQLGGFSAEQIGAAAAAAKDRGLAGQRVITLQNTTGQPALAQLTDRSLRQRILAASSARGQEGPADNRGVVVKILALRAEKAALLGYSDFASYALAEETAGTPAAVDGILGKLAPPALAKAKEEAADIERQIDLEAKAAKAEPFALQPWDWAFYAQKVRAERFGFDASQVKPYFELNRVLQDGVLYAANRLYGITFTERHDLPVYQPDVRVFEVHDSDGKPLGLILLDYFKRDNKQGGAWMDTFVDQSTLLGESPVIVNNLNIPKPAAGQPALLTFDEVTGMFHEFGHLLHGLFSAAKYPLVAGTNVPPDFVEFPSQFNEMWARDPQVLANIAKHYQTGEPMPKELLAKVLAAGKFGEGYATLEYLEAAMLDLAWHQTPAAKLPPAEGVSGFEEAALAHKGVLYPPVPPRYRTTYFLHIFTSGYEAGYYAYIWSEVLARDAGAWFMAHGGMTRANGDLFRAKILSRGRTQEPSVLFREFYGRDPDIAPLLDYRGLGHPKEGGH